MQDRSRDLPPRACDHVVKHLLEPACERRVELRPRNRPGRSGELGGARRPAERGGNERAGGAYDERPFVSPSLDSSAGAIISTVGDVADFYRGLLAGRLLQPDELKEMKTMVSAGSRDAMACPAGCSYGLGLMRWPTTCGLAWGGDGGIPGYAVRSLSTENGQRQVVLMINHDPDTLAKPARLHLQLLVDRLIAKAYCAGT